MIGELPKALLVNGSLYPIESDYRIVLNLFDELNSDELTNFDKAYLTMRTLYSCDISEEDFVEAVKSAYWFISGGDKPKSEPREVKLVDWKHDESMIFSAVNKTAGCEVRSLPYLHWWTFLGYFAETGEGLLSTVLTIRTKLADGKKLEKWEQEFLRKHKELVVLRTKDEQAAIDETEKFLKTLLEE